MANRTLEQQRAAAALAFTQGQRDKSNKQRAKLHTLIQKVPILILQNGLGQTLAFLLADAKGEGESSNAERLLLDSLGQWLRRQNIYPGAENLMDQLTSGDRHQYLHAQREALALLGWMKKFAEAWLKEGE